MIQRVDTVLIGKKANVKASTDPTSWGSEFNEGDVAIFNENRMPITSAADAATIYVGVFGKTLNCTTENGESYTTRLVEYSSPIKKDSKPRVHFSAYKNPVEQSVTINLANATIVAGHRYVIRIVYKDIEGAPGQFTHTYEHYATSSSAADLLSVLAKKINRHANRRVIVNYTANANNMTLTAMAKTDNDGVNSLNEYSVVNMAVTMYETIPGALLNNIPEDFGAVITPNDGATAGVGYWKQVRDQEVRNMGYKGLVYTGAFPSLSQELKTVEGAEYDVITIENDNLYLSNDNQYIKTTPIVTEIYCPKAEDIKTALKTFASMVTLKDETLGEDSEDEGSED